MSEHRHPRCVAPPAASVASATPHPLVDVVRGLIEDVADRDARIAELERKLEAVMCWGLVLFADGELDEERANAFRSHLERCADCRESLRANNAMDALLREAALPRPPKERDDG